MDPMGNADNIDPTFGPKRIKIHWSNEKSPWLSRDYSLPETNVAPENGWLEDVFPFWVSAYFQGRTVSFRECRG